MYIMIYINHIYDELKRLIPMMMTLMNEKTEPMMMTLMNEKMMTLMNEKTEPMMMTLMRGGG